jgi:hypothetical protein
MSAFGTQGEALRQSDYHSGHITVIHPCATDQTLTPMHLLGMEMVSVRAVPWAQGLTLQGSLRQHPYQTEWTRFILRRGREEEGEVSTGV